MSKSEIGQEMNQSIHITRSREEERLISNTLLPGPFGDLIIWGIILGTYPLFLGLVLVEQLDRTTVEISLAAFASFLITGSFLVIILNRLLKVRELHRYSGVDSAFNRQCIRTIARNNDFCIQKDNKNITVMTLYCAFSSWADRIVIIYDTEDILVNCTTLGYSFLKSPFHRIRNRQFEKTVVQEFKARILEEKYNRDGDGS